MKWHFLVAVVTVVVFAVSFLGHSAEFQAWINTDLTWATSHRATRADAEWRPNGYAYVQSELWGIWRQGATFLGVRVVPLETGSLDWEEIYSEQILGGICGVDVVRDPNAKLSLSAWFRSMNGSLVLGEDFRVFSSAHLAYRLPVDDDFVLEATIEASFEFDADYDWLELEAVCIAQPLPWLQIKLGGFIAMQSSCSDFLFRGIVAGVSMPLRGAMKRPLIPLLH